MFISIVSTLSVAHPEPQIHCVAEGDLELLTLLPLILEVYSTSPS